MDGLKMLLVMALFFGVMYLYCWLPEYLGPYRERRKAKKEEQKEAQRKARRANLLKKRATENEILQQHSDRVKAHMEWVDEMNAKIRNRFNLEEEV